MIGAIAQLGSTILSNIANADENYAQRVFSEDMWRKNNEYNTPANQMKRLRAAGINPHFALSGGQLGTGNSSSPASTPSAISYDFSPIGEAVNRSVELMQQKELNDAEVDFKNQQAHNWSIKNITQLWKDMTEVDNMIKSGKLTDQETELAKLHRQELWTNLQTLAQENRVRIDKIQSEKQLNDARARVENAHASYQEILNAFVPQQQQIITDNLRKEGNKIDSEVSRNNREGALAAANEALSKAQENGVRIDNNTKRKMSEYIVDEKFAQAEEAHWKAGISKKQFKDGYVGTALPAPRYDGFEPLRRRSNSSNGGVR